MSAAVSSEQYSADCNKLKEDLNIVLEKVNLYIELIAAGLPRGDETLNEVVGFLEACKDRMSDVIEAGTKGLISEDLFAHSLKVNDAVLQTLEAEKNGTIPMPITISANEKNSPEKASNFTLLDLEDEFPAEKPAPVSSNSAFPGSMIHSAPAFIPSVSGSSTMPPKVEAPPDVFQNPLFSSGLAPRPLAEQAPASAPVKPAAPIQDDFDAFLSSLKE